MRQGGKSTGSARHTQLFVVEVADGVDDVVARVGYRPAAAFAAATGRQVRGDQLPLGIAGVRRVAARTGRG
ncbi:hypothetical protein, partial [Micromonospora fulviviridis]|uniref:hypothetical protein n=1 Tax=Micromonospora fulviviridis TaxID=47860 RepID=UPI0037B2EE4D